MGKAKRDLPWGRIVKRDDQNCKSYYYWKYYDKKLGYQKRRSTQTDDEKKAFSIAMTWAVEYLSGSSDDSNQCEEDACGEDTAGDLPGPGMTIDTAARLYLHDLQSTASSSYFLIVKLHLRNKVIPFFGEAFPINEIRPVAIGRFRNHLVENFNLQPQTINKVLTHLSQVLKFCADNEWLDSMPYIKKLSEQRQQHGYEINDEQITALLNAAASVSPDALRYVALGLYCGLRHSESVGIEWKNIDWNNDCIILEKQKNKSADPAPLGRCREILELSDGSERIGKVVGWVDPHGKRNPVSRCTKTWRTVKRLANQIIESIMDDEEINDKKVIKIDQRQRRYIPDSLRYHDLRHTFVSRMFRILGYDARHLSRHSSGEAFTRYLHSDKSAFLKRAGEAFLEINK